MHSQTWQILSTHDVYLYVIQNMHTCFRCISIHRYFFKRIVSFLIFTKVKSRVVVIAASDISHLFSSCHEIHVVSTNILIKLTIFFPVQLKRRVVFVERDIRYWSLQFRKEWINKMLGPLNIFCIPAFLSIS